MNIDQEYPGTGLIDKFLSELISEDFILKLELMPSEVSKVFSLLLLLKERRSKSFPQILACIELMIDKYLANVEIVDEIIKKIINLSNRCNNLYDKIWLDYFLKTLCKASLLNKELNKSPLLKSVKTNKQKFFTDEKDIVLFRKIDPLQNNIKLAEHLAIFNKNANQ